jgi:hypothetical protein
MSGPIPIELITSASQEVRTALKSDLCSYSWLRHILKEFLSVGIDVMALERQVISNLLISGIEIGQTFLTERNGKARLGFRAWKGTVNERIERAYTLLSSYPHENDRDWAFWFCLPQNVDEYETQ